MPSLTALLPPPLHANVGCPVLEPELGDQSPGEVIGLPVGDAEDELGGARVVPGLALGVPSGGVDRRECRPDARLRPGVRGERLMTSGSTSTTSTSRSCGR